MTGSQPRPLSFEALTIGYGGVPVADALTGRFDFGKVHALTGPNGCGKTTLLRTLIGLQPGLAGRVDVDPSLSISYVPQVDSLDGGFPITCTEFVATGRRRPVSRRDAKTLALHSLEAVGLAKHGATPFFRLSTGQRQRVLVARALFADADVVALDEPTSGVDQASALVIWAATRRLAEDGKLVVVVTHDLFRAPQYSDRILILDGEGLIETEIAPIAGAPQ